MSQNPAYWPRHCQLIKLVMKLDFESPVALHGKLLANEPLAPYTSWRVGGKAKSLYSPKDLNDLVCFFKQSQFKSKQENLFWLGLGSNVLIRGGGFSGTVIHTHNCLNNISICDSTYSGKTLLRIETGVTCAKIARFVARHGLKGAEFFAGIPGTLGGALAMNAGAFGTETWQRVAKVEVINKLGEITIRQANEYEVGYRLVNAPNQDEWFVAGYLCFAKGDVETEKQNIRDLLKVRNKTQPIGVFSCGSVFCNPPGYYAAELIEASKLKGRRKGNAIVSNKHANFIINLGNARAIDIEDLMQEIQDKIFVDHQVRLVPEVRVIGEHE
jgi:UDP-N-acetylmuramate dehydrogenase